MITVSRNVVIEAGAGTGKTTRLVAAILEALIQKRLPLTSIVALTFTKKAAGEMKERIAQELRRLLADENLQPVARTALEQIDRASISTIHSFAFSLVKRFPLAAGIDPNAEVDEKGFRYDELFQKEWPLWLSKELGHHAPHEAAWLEILQRLKLREIDMLARRLCDFEVPLDSLPLSDADVSVRFEPFHRQAQLLCASHNGKEKASQILQACEEVIGIGATGLWEKLETLLSETKELLRQNPATTKTWSDEDIETLKTLQQIGNNIVRRGDRTLSLLTERLKPFVTHFRAQILAQGFLSHSALLYLSRELLRKRHDIRLLLKQEIRMLFIDEFQDTDPLQGELLLFLAETPEGRAKTWQEVEIEEGKLFVVGDPKQSIYRFRGADIAAYRQISDRIQAQGGEKETLQKNYRSHDQIVHVVNAAFETIIQEKELISPAYSRLEAVRVRGESSLQEVELRLVQSADKLSSEEAHEVEANDIAVWIYNQVVIPAKAGIQNKNIFWTPASAGVTSLRYKDIALIFRSTPPMRFFVEALRRRDIPFVVEGERYFYSTPEVTDFLNLMRVIENPKDTLSLAGFLRSPLGGLTDAEILRLKEAGQLEARRWPLIVDLYHRLMGEPLKQVLDHIFEKTFVLELAAGSYHRDQTIANLLKLRRLLESFAEEGATTLRKLLDKMKNFMENDRLEGESPLADENYNAVRLLTIHKAKGLEFPVVFLPGLHTGKRSGQTDEVMVDWSTGRVGLRAGKGFQNLDKLILDWEHRRREVEEEKRVLYVAMTRPRERLVLSGGITLKQGLRSDSYLKRLLVAWKLPLESLTEGDHPIQETHIRVSLIDPATQQEFQSLPRSEESILDKLSPQEFVSRWKEREQIFQKVLAMPILLRPSALVSSVTPAIRKPGSINKQFMDPPLTTAGDDRSNATLLGTLLHKFLEHWDFHEEKCHMPKKLREGANSYFASLGLLKKPFPDPKEAAADPTDPLTPIVEEAQVILANFIGSPAYDEIAQSEILGREIPFFYRVSSPKSVIGDPSKKTPIDGFPIGTPGNDSTVLVRGTIDILYKTSSGDLVIGDYKSDKILGNYEEQGKAYQQAVQRSLGYEARFKPIYLREDLP